MPGNIDIDAPIDDECLLLRRILVRPGSWVVWDPKMGGWRPSSMGFDDHQDGSPMSVSLGDDLLALGCSLEDALKGHEEVCALAAIPVRAARDCGQEIERAPRDTDPAHAHVIGPKTKKSRKCLMRASFWIVPPDLPPPGQE